MKKLLITGIAAGLLTFGIAMTSLSDLASKSTTVADMAGAPTQGGAFNVQAAPQVDFSVHGTALFGANGGVIGIDG